jgi:hypothetical protein
LLDRAARAKRATKIQSLAYDCLWIARVASCTWCGDPIKSSDDRVMIDNTTILQRLLTLLDRRDELLPVRHIASRSSSASRSGIDARG